MPVTITINAHPSTEQTAQPPGFSSENPSRGWRKSLGRLSSSNGAEKAAYPHPSNPTQRTHTPAEQRFGVLPEKLSIHDRPLRNGLANVRDVGGRVQITSSHQARRLPLLTHTHTHTRWRTPHSGEGARGAMIYCPARIPLLRRANRAATFIHLFPFHGSPSSRRGGLPPPRAISQSN